MKIKKIDFHTHILPENIPNFNEKFGYGGFIRLHNNDESGESKIMISDTGKLFRNINCNCYNHNVRLNECDETNVSIQVLSTVPVMFSYWAKPNDTLIVSQFLNDHIADVCKSNPKRFVGLCTLPMNDITLAIIELERCINTLGLKGVQIGTHINNKNLDDESLYPFYQKVCDLDCIIFVHPWDMLGGDRTNKYWMSWLVSMPCETTIAICSIIFGGIYKQFPKIKIVFAHGGGSFFGTLGRIQHGYDVRPDLFPNECSPLEYLKNIYVDSLVHDISMLQIIINNITSDNIVLGSDYPFPLGENNPGNLILNSSINENDKEKILWKNAYNLLKIKY